MQDQITRIDKRLARMERMMQEFLSKTQAVKKDRITEREVMAEYSVSKSVLRRLRLGYKRHDGVDVPPKLFNWRHRNGRDFDYDIVEIEQILGRTTI